MVRHKNLSVSFLNSCKKYEFNNENLKNKLYRENIIQVKEKKKKVIEKIKKEEKDIFIPDEEDSLFWCYIIYKYGYSEYELKREKKYESITSMKIDLVYTVRENKDLLKKLKLRKSKVEENLTNDKRINLDTFLFLIAVNEMNLIYINGQTYYEELYSDEEKICIIKYEKEQDKYGLYDVSKEKLEELKKTRLHILNISKPIKSLSSYKVLELKEICKTLNIDIMKTETKCKTKKELYQLIQEKIN
tara:strand:+ start:6453 stop:7190 length:738 start_codon:yes stop_codon:yes gene_type:complete